MDLAYRETVLLGLVAFVLFVGVITGTYSTTYVAAALVRAGAGLAIVDQFTACSAIADGLERIPLQPEIRFGVQAAWLEDRPPSRLGLDFLKAISDALTGLSGDAGSGD